MNTICVVLSSGRDGRQSERVAEFLYNRIQQKTDMKISYVDIRDCLTTPFTKRYDEESGKDYVWYREATNAQAFLFVLPEYNHGYPGEWKLLMDSLYKNAYIGKVAGLVGVSDGQFGGTRALEQALPLLATRGMYIMKDYLHFPFVQKQFTAEGALIDTEQDTRVEKFLDLFLNTVVEFKAR